MTTTHPHQAVSSRLTFGGILRSEWIKLRTLRSTEWCYLIIVVVTIGFGFLLAGTFPSSQGSMSHDAQQGSWLQVTTLGINFCQLVSAVLGALVITGEYGTGMIRSTLSAVPKRLPALIAKAIVFGVTTFVVSLVSLVATAILTAPLLSGKGITPDFGDSSFWFALVGGAGYLALVGVLSLSIGAIIRSSAGGIAASLGLILVLPVIVQILVGMTRADWARNLGAFLPADAGAKMFGYPVDMGTPPPGMPTPDTVMLEPWQGFLVLAAWFLVVFVIGAILMKRRDV